MLEREAHSLKSVVWIFGAANACGLLGKLEAAAEKSSLEEAGELLERVEREILRVDAGLTSFVREFGLSPSNREKC